MPDTAFSRSAESDPLGKLDARLDVNVPEQVKDDAAFVARASGFKTTGEWVRFIVCRELYGRMDMIQKVVHADVGGNGRNQG